MRRSPFLAALGAAMLAVPIVSQAAESQPAGDVAPLPVPPIGFRERVLANGLRVISSLDRSTPNVAIQVWYGVGAKNDPPGRSGFAHLFEHLMFKATRDLPPESLDRLTEDVGGTNNAFTADDETAYHEIVPAGHLQRLLWAEAERMSALVVDQANFVSERDVVEEELRQSVLAAPYGRFFELDIPKDSFAVHPYRRAPIGSIADLEAASLDDVRAFHQTFYRPDDATLIVVGNFDQSLLDAWVDKWFGAIARPTAPIPRVVIVEPPRAGVRTLIEFGPNVPLPAVAVTWLAPDAADADAPALRVLAAVLADGKSSRLYNALVYRQEIAQQVSAEAELRAQPGLFTLTAIMAAGKTADQGAAGLQAQVAELRSREVTPAELETAKNQLLAEAVEERETIEGRGMALGRAVVLEADPRRADADLAALTEVTAADVVRVARRWLPIDRSTVIRYVAQTTGPAAAPEAAEAPARSARYAGPVATLLPPNERQPPPPVGPAVEAQLPIPTGRRLANGLRVIVARSSDLPLIAAELVIPGGAETDPPRLAGASALAAELVTEGTTSRTAPQIAAAIEALGADLDGHSDAESSRLSLTVLTPQAPAALAIMADVAEHPVFAAEELDRARKEALDGLAVSLQQPADIGRFVYPLVIFAGTPLGHVQDGDAASLPRVMRQDLARLHDLWWRPDNAVLVLAGDLTAEQGFALAERAFGDWTRPPAPAPSLPPITAAAARRDIAVDLPGTGQAVVIAVKPGLARGDSRYYAGVVTNAVLGGGYSARLNEEIRIKRGLSYGAGSFMAWYRTTGAALAFAQTKNASAPLVLALEREEIASLVSAPPGVDELAARKSSLVGEYGRALATADGLAQQIAGLAVNGLDPLEIDRFEAKVEAVSAADVEAFAREVWKTSDLSVVVVGDGKIFAAPLKAAIPDLQVIPARRLDLDSAALTTPGS